MHPPAKTAIGSSDDVLPTDIISVGENAIRNEFPVLDEVGSVADNAGNDNFPSGSLSSLQILYPCSWRAFPVQPFGSSVFRLSAAAVSMSLAGSYFFFSTLR